MSVQLSILMPCLNEARTLPACIGKARSFLARSGISGEIIIADNGSTDGSVRIAEDLGARVVAVKRRGYGHALIEGIRAARGTWIIMGDADDSYDFSALDAFVERLRRGDEVVMGNRFKGGIEADAMPMLHRYLGNPVLSFLGRLFYNAKVGDFHCGLRGFNRARIQELSLNCGGMEFASELVVKATLAGLKISEVPIQLHPDGRDRAPHLNSWKDGWRHLRFLLLFSPRWLFIYPGIMLALVGIVGIAAILPGPVHLGGITLDIHTLLYCSAFTILGLQMFYMGCVARISGSAFNVLPRGRTDRVGEWLALEHGLAVGAIAFIAGLGWSIASVVNWGETNFSQLDPVSTMRSTIPAVTLMITGGQTMIASFFLGALQIYREQHDAG